MPRVYFLIRKGKQINGFLMILMKPFLKIHLKTAIIEEYKKDWTLEKPIVLKHCHNKIEFVKDRDY